MLTFSPLALASFYATLVGCASLEVEVEFKGTLVVNFGLLFALERAQVGSLVAQGLSFLHRCSAHQQLAVVGRVELELARQCVL